MWIFIFVLAMVPMIFYWSDSVVTVFPQLAQYLPEKKSNAPGVNAVAAAAPIPAQLGAWSQVSTDKGYAAWLLSADGQHRLAVGCRKAPPLLQVTQINGKALGRALVLDFQYGQVPLTTEGVHAGSDVIAAVAQFDEMTLRAPATGQPTEQLIVARFTADRYASGQIARSLQLNCR